MEYNNYSHQSHLYVATLLTAMVSQGRGSTTVTYASKKVVLPSDVPASWERLTASASLLLIARLLQLDACLLHNGTGSKKPLVEIYVSGFVSANVLIPLVTKYNGIMLLSQYAGANSFIHRFSSLKKSSLAFGAVMRRISPLLDVTIAPM